MAECIPLPNVPDVTDRIEFSHLHFPIGFDESRIGINVRGIERVLSVAGLGGLSVRGVEGQATDVTPDIVGVGSDGAPIAGSRSSIRPQDLQEINLDYGDSWSLPHSLRWPVVRVRMNIAERDRSIRDAATRQSHDMLDPKVQSNLLNGVIKQALREGANQYMRDSGVMAGIVTAALIGAAVPVGMHLLEYVADLPSAATIPLVLVILGIASIEEVVDEAWEYDRKIQDARLSALFGWDCLARARLRIAASTFVKPLM